VATPLCRVCVGGRWHRDLEEDRMSIKVAVEFQAKPGKRAELRSLLGSMAAAHGPGAPGFLGSTVYEALDSADGLIEIAEWESAEAQAAGLLALGRHGGWPGWVGEWAAWSC
jgi:heme-degrading monooxygenase HmoA